SFCLLSVQPRDLRSRDPLECESVRQPFLKPAAKARRERHPRVSQRERALLVHVSSQFPRSREQRFTSNDLVHRAIFLRLCRAQFLATEQEVTTANLADDFGPHDMQAVTGHDAEYGMRRILKVGMFRGNDDVAEQGILDRKR